jgi:histidinol-phosphate aminotransferase
MISQIRPRPEVLEMSEAVHGGIDCHELTHRHLDPQSIIDFSSNCNPFGPSPRVAAAVARASLDRYPDREAASLRTAISRQIDVSPDRLIAGNGSSELLHLVSLAFLGPGDSVVIAGPTYGEYARSATIMGGRSHFCFATIESEFAVPFDDISQAIRALHPRMCFVCNPNNPTGRLISADAIHELTDDFPQTLFVADEAYIEFAPEARSLVSTGRHNLVVVRSLTKAYGLAGVRLGYAVADPEVIDSLRRVRIPWSVNAVAQAAGISALDDQLHMQRCVARLIKGRQTLTAGLEARGFRPLPTATHFFLVPTGDGAAARDRMLESKVLVRDCTSFGLPDFIRVSSRDERDISALIEAFEMIEPLRLTKPGCNDQRVIPPLGRGGDDGRRRPIVGAENSRSRSATDGTRSPLQRTAAIAPTLELFLKRST